jgi:predicted membrane-bound dolichyl-phosphate-mannose-protein mannosyltransferase
MRFYPGLIGIVLSSFLYLAPTLALATTIQAGPWLQAITETSAVIMWSTDTHTKAPCMSAPRLPMVKRRSQVAGSSVQRLSLAIPTPCCTK